MAASVIDAVALKSLISSAGEPTAIQNLRLAALERAKGAALPARDDEAWRKVDLSGLDPFAFGSESPGSVLDWPDAPANVFIGDITRASANEPLAARITTAFEQALRDASDVFALQNLGCYSKSAVVLARGAVESPVRLVHALPQGRSLIHRTLVFAEANTELTVVETFRGHASEELQFWNPGVQIFCGRNARVNYLALFEFEGAEYCFHRFLSEQAADSRVHVSIARLGGFLSKSFYTGRVLERGAEFRAIGVAAGSGREFSDVDMLVEHLADHTQSSLHYKTVMKDRAHSVFNGNLLIPAGRRKVSSHQVNNNILLARTARAESMPRLIIKAEDVSCEHGATVGELDREAIFFLQARGLSESEARTLLIEGFLQQILAEFPLADSIEPILAALKRKLAL